ncbi:unnamed protein product [Symbiodinium microadriaticum]|nr:unnamed protein product [Symbiodinium microadriaticum]
MAAVRAIYGEDVVRGDASQRQTAVPWMLQQGRLDTSGLEAVPTPWMGQGYMQQDLYGDVNNSYAQAAEGFSNDRQVRAPESWDACGV